MRTLLLVLVVSACARPVVAWDVPESSSEADTLRSQLEALRAEYAQRLAQLDARLAALTPPRGEAAAPPPAPAEAAVPAGAAGSAGPASSLPVYGGGSAASKVFNPDISAVGDFIGAAGRSPGGVEPSLAMHEAELGFQAVVDPYARADFFLTFGPDEVGVEEGFITFPAAPGGLLLRVGKMR